MELFGVVFIWFPPRNGPLRAQPGCSIAAADMLIFCAKTRELQHKISMLQTEELRSQAIGGKVRRCLLHKLHTMCHGSSSMVPISSGCHEPNQDFSITSPSMSVVRGKHLLLTRGLSHHRSVRAPRCTGLIDTCAKMSFGPQAVARRESQCAAQCPCQRPRTSLLSCKWVAQGVTRVPKTLHASALTGDQVAEMQNNS